MNKYFLVVFFLTLTQLSFSQETFFKVYETPTSDEIYDAIEASDEGILLVGRRFENYNDRGCKGLVMKIDKHGEFIKEITQSPAFVVQYAPIDNAKNANDEFLVFGNMKNYEPDYISHISMLKIDLDLNVLELKTTHESMMQEIVPWKHNFVNDSTLLLVSTRYFSRAQGMAIDKIKLPEFESVANYMYGAQGLTLGMDIIYLPSTNGIHAVYFGSEIDGSLINITQFDMNLNPLVTKKAPHEMYSTPCITTIDDSSYYLTGSAYTPHGTGSVRASATYRIDQNADAHNGAVFYNHPDTILYCGFGTNTVLQNDTLYVVGLYNLIISPTPWQTEPTWIELTRLDKDLNILDHKFYGGDAVYRPYSIITTADDGVVVSGRVYDYNAPGQPKNDAFVLKLNSKGLLTSVPKKDDFSVSESVVYPNPASDVVEIRYSEKYKNARLMLMDISGRLVMERKLLSHQEKVDIRHLNPGTYLYLISNASGLNEAGKLVVN